MINYYKRCLPSAAETQAPLYSLTTENKKTDKRLIQWNNAAEQVFKKCKNQLANATLLMHPAENAFTNTQHASAQAIGTALEQVRESIAEVWQLEYLSQFIKEIKYVAEQDNIIADTDFLEIRSYRDTCNCKHGGTNTSITR
ncbi:uncharacterized protein LOC105429928 [Pogonomyrmex barbatus]|uniref:Uncharacterized protein LOC105429928 n=1 Tax=Pogonomyrmex barbatus TaxID=144034 RepID=A0A8N1S9J2_9HYME|nr:uncharacterized protein LOC105429928 [Pogonomyrmex barbatus]